MVGGREGGGGGGGGLSGCNYVTSGHLTDVTSGHVTSGDVLSGDVTSGSTHFPNYDGLQILKTVEVLIKPLTCGCRHTHRVMMKNPIIF